MLYVSKGLNLTPEQHKEKKKEKRKTPNTLTVTIKKPAPSTLQGERGKNKKEKRLKRLPFSIELFQEMTCKLFFSSFLVFRCVSR
jgi:hypothetical protein